MSALPRMVNADMVPLCRAHHNILWAIIGLATIHVVNDLGFSQMPSDRLFGHKPVFVDAAVFVCAWVTLWRDDGDVAIFRQRAASIPSWILRAAYMVTEHIQRAILTPSSNDSSTPAPTEHGHGVILRLRPRQQFRSILQIVGTLLFWVVGHKLIVTHSVYHNGVYS